VLEIRILKGAKVATTSFDIAFQNVLARGFFVD
jgi:hypothetical protein